MNKLAIEVSNLIKRFRREKLTRNWSTWKTLAINPIQRQRQHDKYFTVINGISFNIKAGRTVAIIGENGSGKSTLLKILANIYKPDAGQIKIQGRVSTLIELGAGFHPEFSGRENIMLNGSILGLTKKEIISRFNDIVAYSGLGEFIDAPVRTYSSGMYVRLGFSVAVNVDPDILLIDEILSVGDEAFAYKCKKKIDEFKQSGKNTICIVTHDLKTVQKIADEVIWLNKGCIAAYGNADQVIKAYLQKISTINKNSFYYNQYITAEDALKQSRWGNGTILIDQIRLLNNQEQEQIIFSTGDTLIVEINYHIVHLVKNIVFGIALHNAQNILCYGTNTLIDRISVDTFPKIGIVFFKYSYLNLLQGTYSIDVATHAADGQIYDYYKRAISFTVYNQLNDEGIFRIPHNWEIKPRGDK